MDKLKEETENKGESRSQLIKSIKTPLSFFVLVVIIIDGFLAVLASTSDCDERAIMIYGSLIILLIVIISVVLLTFFRPQFLYKLQSNENLFEGVKELNKISKNTKKVLTTIFPQKPENVGLEEWQIIIGLIRDQINLSNNLIETTQKLLK